MNKGRLALLAAVAFASLGAAAPSADLLIRGGTSIPDRAAPFVGDVAVTADRITAVAPKLRLPAKRVIDARGLIVAPGFIDPHTHAGAQLAADDAQVRLLPGFLMQGVTTVVIGNDGGGDPDVAALLGSAAVKPVGLNYAALVGFGAVRKAAVGEADRAPTAAELARMKKMVASAMCGGAFGLSTGLFYAPQSYARTEEVVALAREAGLRGGLYDTHPARRIELHDRSCRRRRGSADDRARGAAAGQHLHIKALGVDVHGQAPAIIAKVEAARRAGQRVTGRPISLVGIGHEPGRGTGAALGAGWRPRRAC
jgi:N-acyl-D-aspartate/D-glutamate deacylase